jgi:hypothetical protein
MEEVLDVYEAPYDPAEPVVCFDEVSQQLVAEVRASQPARPGQPERVDDEYERRGTRHLFLFCEPLAGWRGVAVTEPRTMPDFAHPMKGLLEVQYPQAATVHGVLDHLNTHRPASLYETFASAEARGLLKRLRGFTPPPSLRAGSTWPRSS